MRPKGMLDHALKCIMMRIERSATHEPAITSCQPESRDGDVERGAPWGVDDGARNVNPVAARPTGASIVGADMQRAQRITTRSTCGRRIVSPRIGVMYPEIPSTGDQAVGSIKGVSS